MTANHTRARPPRRLVDLDAERPGHGVDVDRVAALLTVGDPLADAVIAELDRHGARARNALATGLRRGLASLSPQPPTAVAALLRHLEATPSRVDPLMLHRGDLVSLSVPPMWFELCSVTSALAYVYRSPAVARALTGTGGPADVAVRLAETGVWARRTIQPGGLLRGGPGYVATVEARLAHARMRATALADWNRGVRGLPVGHLDLARTWLGFTLVAYRSLAGVGIDISRDEERSLYQYWSYVAHLLGLDESLTSDLVDHEGACRLHDLLDATTAGPDEHSTALTAAMIDAQSHAVAGTPGAVLPEEQVRQLIGSVLRQAFGDQWGVDLPGFPGTSAATDLMPLINHLNRQARYWQTYSPGSAQEARRRPLEEPGPQPRAATHFCGLSCRRHTAADCPAFRAA
ncbi:oxygenase MpaB family protein [Streptomyces sp. NPDC001076]